ncbi:MAG: 3-oxoacyl-ACP reductase FabG [Thermodesulfobacteriota bacterium]
MTSTPRTVLVTGGSRGIGAAIAIHLARAGYRIWLNYLQGHEAAAEVEQQIIDLGGHCRLLPFDVADEEQTLATLDPLLAEEPVFGLVHNAGITRDGLLAMMSREDWDKVIGVHLNSFFILARLFSKAMIPQRQGRIIGLASVSGETGHAGQVNYAAAKGGLIAACKSLARELGRRNILVNVVSPGFIETDMTKEMALDQVLPLIPLGRQGTVNEVAGLVRFLMGEEASYITGQVLSVNGGLHM